MERWLPEFSSATISCLEMWWGSSIISEFCRESLVCVCIYPYIHTQQIWFERVCLVVDCGFVFRGIEILHLPKSACLTCHWRQRIYLRIKARIFNGSCVRSSVFSNSFLHQGFGISWVAKSCKAWDLWKLVTSRLLASWFQFCLVHWMQARQHMHAPVSCVTQESHHVCLIMLN